MAELFVFPSVARPAPATHEPADAAERQAALDPHRSFLVEAPAGSGKTALLIQRFLILLAQPEVEQPSQVLAITFTRDATAELRSRVLTQLREAEAGSVPTDSLGRQVRPLAEAVLQRNRALGWHLLDDPRQLNIQTIDAVCAGIARSLPVLSGAGGNLRPLENPATLYAEAARRTLARMGGGDTQLSAALRTILLHRDADLGNTEKLIAGMLAVRDQWAALVPLRPSDLTDEVLDRDVLPRQQAALRAAIEPVLAMLAEVMPPSLLDGLCRLAAESANLPAYGRDESPLLLCAGRHRSPSADANDLKHWQALIHLLIKDDGTWRSPKGLTKATLRFELHDAFKVTLKQLLADAEGDDVLRQCLHAVAQLPPAEYPREQWQVTRDLLRVLSHALAELQLVFAERGACDFAELSLLARSALRQEGAAEDLALATGGRLQHLLVDEMQDTSSSQYELLHLLTRTWDGRSQTVFLVGDPKQSIYLFREARVERFLQTMQRRYLGEISLEVLHLTANFRSQQHLVEAFNTDFADIFAADGTPQAEAIEYRAASFTQRPTLPDPRHWHATLLPDDDTKPAQVFRDAHEIRDLIERWRETPLPSGRTEPWRIAVLVRNRNHLSPVVDALREGPHPIPYRAVNIDALGEQPEILDLLALTRALLHPGDRTAWLALLRSPLCGLSLHALHSLSGADDDTLRTTPVPALLASRICLLEDEEDRRAAARFRSVLDAALARSGTMRLAEWVHRTWLTFGADRFLSPERQGNTERYLELLDAAEAETGEGEPVDLRLLASRLEDLYSNPVSVPGAVDLMTIHGAKGLEWDVLFIPALERLGGKQDDRLLAWLEVEGSAEGDDLPTGLLAPIQARGSEAARLNSWMSSLRRQREFAELKRLFYVGCTRARQELHLFSSTRVNKQGELCADSRTLLRAALPAAAPHFAPAPKPVPAPVSGTLAFPDAIPLPDETAEPGWLDRLAASAAPGLHRIPVSSTLPLPEPVPTRSGAAAPIARVSTGNFPSQALGNVVHALLDLQARDLADAHDPGELLNRLPGVGRRAYALLRAEGLSAADCMERAPRVLTLLENTLRDPVGQWVLAPHPQAVSEQELQVGERVLRPDRTFLAAGEPLSTGTTHRWVVDYKTASPGSSGLVEFLAQERVRHTPQMQLYAAALAGPLPVRLALYYPSIPTLLVVDSGQDA